MKLHFQFVIVAIRFTHAENSYFEHFSFEVWTLSRCLHTKQADNDTHKYYLLLLDRHRTRQNTVKALERNIHININYRFGSWLHFVSQPNTIGTVRAIVDIPWNFFLSYCVVIVSTKWSKEPSQLFKSHAPQGAHENDHARSYRGGLLYIGFAPRIRQFHATVIFGFKLPNRINTLSTGYVLVFNQSNCERIGILYRRHSKCVGNVLPVHYWSNFTIRTGKRDEISFYANLSTPNVKTISYSWWHTK